MNCDEIRQNLSAYQDRELDAALSGEVESHLCSCAECARRLADYRRIFSALGLGPRAAPAPDMARRVMDSIAAERAIASPSKRSWLKIAAAAAGVALVAAGLFVAIGGSKGPTPAPEPAVQVSFDDVVAAVEKDPALLDILDNLEELELIEVLEHLPILEKLDDLRSPVADELALAARAAALEVELPLEERD